MVGITRSKVILFISWYPACLFSGCSLRSKVSWHQEGLAWERVWGYFCGNASGLRHTESILINWILLVWAPLICHLHILSLGIEVHKVMVHPIANIWGEVCFTKSKVCHDVMRRLLAAPKESANLQPHLSGGWRTQICSQLPPVGVTAVTGPCPGRDDDPW